MIAPTWVLSSAFSLPFRLPPVVRFGGEKGTRPTGGLEGERSVLGPACAAITSARGDEAEVKRAASCQGARPAQRKVIEIEFYIVGPRKVSEQEVISDLHVRAYAMR